jgi:hypothetical protein
VLGLIRWRNHQPEIGRFFGIDPIADRYVYNSPYAFAENKLGLGIELEGLELKQLTGTQLEVAEADGKAPDNYKPTPKQKRESDGGLGNHVVKKVARELGKPTIVATNVKMLKNVEGHSAKVGTMEVASVEIKLQRGEDPQVEHGGKINKENKIKAGGSYAEAGAQVEAGASYATKDGVSTLEGSTSMTYGGFGVTKTYAVSSDGTTKQTTRTGFNIGGGYGTGVRP